MCSLVVILFTAAHYSKNSMANQGCKLIRGGKGDKGDMVDSFLRQLPVSERPLKVGSSEDRLKRWTLNLLLLGSGGKSTDHFLMKTFSSYNRVSYFRFWTVAQCCYVFILITLDVK